MSAAGTGGRMLWAGAILASVLAACSGATAPKAREERAGALDLAAILAPAAGTDGEAFRRGLPVTRKGTREEADVLIAPAAVEARVPALRGGAVLQMRAAPVFNIGDGVRMEILLVVDGIERELYSRTFDAARRSADREWTALSVPLAPVEGGDVVLRIRASAGPQGDLAGDWLALAAPRLLTGGGL